MTTVRYKSFYLVMLVILKSRLLKCEDLDAVEAMDFSEKIDHESAESGQPEARALFSPRVDYNEWMPVGRGDPLKNDPTFDYSPPVLDRVRYWGEVNKDKKEILLLGVPSKRQNTKKEPKYNSIRRNYIPQLATRLMPPPMQTISPNPKPISSDSYQGSYTHHNPHASMGNYWGQGNSNQVDSHPDESINFVNIARPGGNKPHSPNEIVDYKPHSSPPIHPTVNRKPWIHELLEKEVTRPTTDFVMQPSKNIYESHSSIGPVTAIFTPTPPPVPPIGLVSPIFTPTPPPTSFPAPSEPPTFFQPTIPPISMTTDSLFSHYKQPAQPIHGPMYLIIEGHSKVKNYGSKDNETELHHQPKIVPVPVKKDPVVQHVVSQDDSGKVTEIKHLHEKPEMTTIRTTELPTGMGSLLSLLDSSLGNLFMNEASPKKDEDKRPSKKVDSAVQREGRQIFDYDQLPDSEGITKSDKFTTNEPRSVSFTTVEGETVPTEIV